MSLGNLQRQQNCIYFQKILNYELLIYWLTMERVYSYYIVTKYRM